jgi:hypothetical protein
MYRLQIALGVSWYAIAISGVFICQRHPRLSPYYFFTIYGVLALMAAIHFLKLSRK